MNQEVTNEQVWQAADELKAKGEEVNNATVRMHLGGIGHFEVIHQAMEQWRAKRGL